MKNFYLTIVYKGTRYVGLQIQKNARTDQVEPVNAMKEVFNKSKSEFNDE